jgi:hypothetical protein
MISIAKQILKTLMVAVLISQCPIDVGAASREGLNPQETKAHTNRIEVIVYQIRDIVMNWDERNERNAYFQSEELTALVFELLASIQNTAVQNSVAARSLSAYDILEPVRRRANSIRTLRESSMDFTPGKPQRITWTLADNVPTKEISIDGINGQRYSLYFVPELINTLTRDLEEKVARWPEGIPVTSPALNSLRHFARALNVVTMLFTDSENQIGPGSARRKMAFWITPVSAIEYMFKSAGQSIIGSLPYPNSAKPALNTVQRRALIDRLKTLLEMELRTMTKMEFQRRADAARTLESNDLSTEIQARIERESNVRISSFGQPKIIREHTKFVHELATRYDYLGFTDAEKKELSNLSDSVFERSFRPYVAPETVLRADDDSSCAELANRR